MSLYDDEYDTAPQEKVQGWSSGIKLLQSQLQLKKATVTQPKRDQARKASLAPVIDLKKPKRDDDEPGLPIIVPPLQFNRFEKNRLPIPIVSGSGGGIYGSDFDWNVTDEYDPMWPNQYEKLKKELRDKDKNSDRDRDRFGDRAAERFGDRLPDRFVDRSLDRFSDRADRFGDRGADRFGDRDRDKDRDSDRKKDTRRKSRFDEQDASPPRSLNIIPPSSTPQMSQPPLGTGFAGRWASEEEEEIRPKTNRPIGGAAIAPPPSLQEPSPDPLPILPNKAQPRAYGGSVAAKIMARYGFKEGQGLGRMEQGMSMALQVEKTSKRGGRILHEKDIMPPPPPVVDVVPEKKDPPITEIVKNPSKVVLLKNMVGPGQVDEDLEPEVREECNTKYGPVSRCTIQEVANVVPEETVRIFVEFQRIESAIKAVVDLNGRFFGGRQVKANFYDTEKFDNFELMD